MLRKKWLSLLVAVSMVAAMMPTTAFAEEVDTTTGTEVVTSTPKEGEGTESTSAEEKTEPTEDEVKEGAESTEGKTEEGTESAEGETEGDTESTEDKTEEDTESTEGKTEEDSESTEGEEDDAVVSDANGNEDAGLPEIALMANTDNVITVAPNEDLANALQNAEDGTTIQLQEGTYTVGSVTTTKAVSIQGASADKTTIVGSITFAGAYQKGTTIRVRDLTIKAPENNTTMRQAIGLSSADGAVLSVYQCTIDGFLYAIGVNSNAQNCELRADRLTLKDVWCGAGVKTGDSNNEVTKFGVATGSDVVYQIQDFSQQNGGYSSKYYDTYTNYVENPETPALEGTDKEPDPSKGNWPAVAVVDGAYYGDLTEAIAAGEGKTVTLTDDVYLDEMLVITTSNLNLDLDGYTISASDNFASTFDNDSHLVQVGGEDKESEKPTGVVICNGELKATSKNKNALNVYQAGAVELSNLTVNHANAAKGAPLVVNASDVTLTGTVNFVTGDHSWYAVNVDSKGEKASLTFAENAVVDLGEGVKGVQVDGSTDANPVTVEFESGVTVTGSDYPLVFNTWEADSKAESVKVTGLENTNLKDTPIVGAAATVDGEDGVYYTTLQDAVNAIENNAGTIRLVNDVDLGTTPVEVPAGMNLTVEGNNHTITLNNKLKPGIAAFNESTSMEGLKAGTTLVVNNVNFQGKEEVQNGHAVIVGGQGGVTVALNNCNYTNLHEAVYCNNVNDARAEKNSITIDGGTFTNVAYSYSVDDGATTGARTDKHDFVVTGITEGVEPETFAVATVDGVGYTDLQKAVDAAEGKEVTLLKDVTLDVTLKISKSNITLNLNQHTITASDKMTENTPVIDVAKGAQPDERVTGITIKDGEVVAGTKNKHTVNVYNAADVVLENVKLDNTNALSGDALVVNSSDVTLKGGITIVTGDNSWHGVNVDAKVAGQGASLKLDDKANVVFEGVKTVGIYVENTQNLAKDQISVAFGEGSSIKSSIPGFIPLAFAKDGQGNAVGTAIDPDNAGLKDNGDGTYSLIPASSGSHHDYQWMHNNDKHWQLCSDCGSVINEGTHNFQWKQDENGVGYQQCAECGYRKSATQTAAAATTNNATASASASTTTNATATAAIPQTSDASNPLLWVVLLVISGSAFGGLMVYKKKKEDC